MVAPSQHVSGRHYEWKYLPTANDKFPQLPTALLTAINGPSTNGTKPPLDLASIFDGVPEGQRDEKLFRALCKIRSQNLPKDFALEYALKAAANCQPPFPERLVVEKVDGFTASQNMLLRRMMVTESRKSLSMSNPAKTTQPHALKH